VLKQFAGIAVNVSGPLSERKGFRNLGTGATITLLASFFQSGVDRMGEEFRWLSRR
jgi:hypothetical protein